MKRVALLFLCMLMAIIAIAGQEWYPYTGNYGYTFTVDTTGDSTRYDSTFYVGPTWGFKSIKGRVIISPAASDFATGAGGVFEDDSVWVWVYSVFAGELTLLDSAVAGAAYDTLDFFLADDVGDTLLGDGLAIKVEAYDSINDTVSTGTQGYINWRVNYHFKLK